MQHPRDRSQKWQARRLVMQTLSFDQNLEMRKAMIIQPKRWLPHDIAANNWADGFCTTDWCTAGGWMVRRDDRHPDLWLVVASIDDCGWRIAGVEPACPLCGMGLSPHIEGVGDMPGAADNPLAAYARRLAA
jgi:hypothetical protein